jgi:hypothetical protein
VVPTREFWLIGGHSGNVEEHRLAESASARTGGCSQIAAEQAV